MRYVFVVLIALLLVAVSSGCVQSTGNDQGNGTTEYEYYNTSVNETTNETIRVPMGDFVFKIHGENELWFKPNKSMKFYVVFNNVDEDGEAHDFIAKAHPSAADFDVMAGYQCLHFATCTALKNNMKDYVKQPTETKMINYTFVGLYTMEVSIPEDVVSGTYVYNMIACQDMEFAECNETSANWGPNIPLIVHVL